MYSRFRFKGSAIGLAGRITYPFNDLIEVQAASALPDTGGYGSSRSAKFRFREILSFDLAHTEVIGTTLSSDNTYSTLCKATVEGLNVLEMVTADRIVANLVSTCTPDGNESSIKLIGSYFENLRIAGIPVEVDLAIDVFDKYDTYALLAEAYRTDESVRKLFHDIALKERYHAAPPKVARWFSAPSAEDRSELPSQNGVTAVSLVRKLTPASSALQSWGHVIYIPGFGTIRLAELGVSAATRTLTMLQIDLGSPVGGNVTASAVDDGGTTW
jgi:hypothetical protein